VGTTEKKRVPLSNGDLTAASLEADAWAGTWSEDMKAIQVITEWLPEKEKITVGLGGVIVVKTLH